MTAFLKQNLYDLIVTFYIYKADTIQNLKEAKIKEKNIYIYIFGFKN